MKDNRFIELLNLYIDRQITAAETAELEAEMQDNPRRRAIYRQYCQLHSATKQVYDSFRANAASPQPGQPAGRVVLSDIKRRSRWNWIHYAGGLTAAACLALVFVRFNAGTTPSGATPGKVEFAPAVQVAVLPPAPAKAVSVAATPAPGPVSLRNSLNGEPDYAAMLATLRRDEQRAFANGEIQAGRLPSLFDDGVFDAHQLSPAKGQRIFRGKQTPEQQAEFTAFQFQR
jgi:hypothetical protein